MEPQPYMAMGIARHYLQQMQSHDVYTNVYTQIIRQIFFEIIWMFMFFKVRMVRRKDCCQLFRLGIAGIAK